MTATQPRVRMEEVTVGWWRVECDTCGHTSLGTPNHMDALAGAEYHETHCPDTRLAALLASLETLRARWTATSMDLANAAEHYELPVDARKKAIADSATYAVVADDLHRVIEGARG